MAINGKEVINGFIGPLRFVDDRGWMSEPVHLEVPDWTENSQGITGLFCSTLFRSQPLGCGALESTLNWWGAHQLFQVLTR